VVTLCGWEGNYRSGVTLAMRHGLSGLSACGLSGQCLGDEHIAYILVGNWLLLALEALYPYIVHLCSHAVCEL